MKYTCRVIIDKSRAEVAGSFTNPHLLKHWQEGLHQIDHYAGEEGKTGSKAKLIYKFGKRRVELIETIIHIDLPDLLIAQYETSSMTNTMSTKFTELTFDQTLLESTVEYTTFNGLMAKLMAWFIPGTFRKQTQKWLENFKTMMEFPETKIHKKT